MTVVELIPGLGMANGNLEYSSTTVSKYILRVADGRGPLKSILSLSIGCVTLINLPFDGTVELRFQLSVNFAI